MEQLLAALIGLATGLGLGLALAAWRAARRRLATQEETAALREEAVRLRSALDGRDEDLAEARAARQHLEEELAAERRTAGELREAQARLQTELQNERQAAAEKLELLDQAQTKLREAFAALSSEALKQNNQSFLELAKAQLGEYQKGAAKELESRSQAIGEMVKPIRESLTKVDTRLEQVESNRREAYGTLLAQIKAMSEGNQQLRSETANLVQALRRPQVRGRWGEMQLRNVVELAGMQDHCDFVEQVAARDEDQNLLRPDMLIRLPGGKSVVVDSKAPLESYLKAMEVGGESATKMYLEEHARQVRAHVRTLAGKAYWRQFDEAPEFVIMFLPGETFFSAALQADPELLEYGVKEQVVLASPTTLIALLYAVAYGWKQEALAQNAREISTLGRELYDRLCTMGDHVGTLGKHLDNAIGAYNKAVRSLESRVFVSARRFRDLEAGSGKELPEAAQIDTRSEAFQSDELGSAGEPPRHED